MPLLRRSHDHCRELRARRPTSRSAVASGRGQDRNAMTSVTASPRRRLPGASLSALPCCRLGARQDTRCIVDQAKIAQPTAAAATNSLPRSSLPRSSLPPTTPANASPTQATAPSNPHRRQPSTRRPAGSFLGGFRTPNLAAHANRHDRPASETLHQTGPSRRSSASGKPLTAPRVGSRALPFGRQTSASRLRGVAL